MSNSTKNQVAQTILEQLGGNQFAVMTGSKDFIARPDGLQFKVGSGAAKKINFAVITLNSQDTYDVEFFRYFALQLTPISSREGIYFDQLQEVFTEETGFHTSLGVRR